MLVGFVDGPNGPQELLMAGPGEPFLLKLGWSGIAHARLLDNGLSGRRPSRMIVVQVLQTGTTCHRPASGLPFKNGGGPVAMTASLESSRPAACSASHLA